MEYLQSLEGRILSKEAYYLSELLYSSEDPVHVFNARKKQRPHYVRGHISNPVINGETVQKAFGIFVMEFKAPIWKRIIFIAFRGSQVGYLKFSIATKYVFNLIVLFV